MSILDFLKRLLVHVTAAATALCLVLAVGEYLVPGSVLPFLDLVDLALLVGALNVVTALVVTRTAKRLVS
jgi:hypothetical protein